MRKTQRRSAVAQEAKAGFLEDFNPSSCYSDTLHVDNDGPHKAIKEVRLNGELQAGRVTIKF